MLIVTQTGEIVNFDCMERVFIEDEELETMRRVVTLGGSRKYATLGWYKDRARADAVVQEIVEVYADAGRRVYRMPKE